MKREYNIGWAIIKNIQLDNFEVKSISGNLASSNKNREGRPFKYTYYKNIKGLYNCIKYLNKINAFDKKLKIYGKKL